MTKAARQRLFATLLGFGSCILIYRAVAMLAGGALEILVAWVAGLLVLELAIDVATLAACARWGFAGDETRATLPLRLGAAAAILHAVRVLIFALARVAPLVNFDVRPEHHASHAERWTWGQVYFASIMSILGVVGVLVIWRLRRRAAGRRG